MLVDFHNHTSLCCHAVGDMDEYVEAAIDRGIRIFGFADHSPWMPQNGIKMALSYEEVPVYISRVKILQDRYSSQIDIRLGMEMDFLPGNTGKAVEFLKKYDFDYAIGSIHHMNTWGFDQETQIGLYHDKSVREIYERYFELIEQLVASGLFDIIGHLDLVKKFGYFPEKGWDDIQNRVAGIIGKSDMVVELNTSGKDKPVGEFYPGPDFLRRLHENNVPVTLGSDSHHPGEVGRYFRQAVELLKEIGYREIMTFEKRKKIPVPLEQ